MSNKKIFEMSHDELVEAYEDAVVEVTKLHNFASKKSLPKAFKWEQALKAELLIRLKGEK